MERPLPCESRDFARSVCRRGPAGRIKQPQRVGAASTIKRSIIEAKGSGLAFFDYDHDGWLDIYLTNGDKLDAQWPAGKAPTSHLYKNNRDGTFTDVTEKSGLGRTGWQTGVCVGDYDNEGGTTCSAASGATTSCFATTETERSPI